VCHFTCKLCIGGTANNCLSCPGNSNRFLTTSGSCRCLQGFYNNNQAACGQCLPYCVTCITTGSTCTSCLIHQFIASVGRCQDCRFSCNNCATIETNCTSCPPNRLLAVVSSAGSCSCIAGYF
jgi:hypothetical protein